MPDETPDPNVSAAPEAAGAMINHIRTDETPHVEYLRTTLSELRARALRTGFEPEAEVATGS